MIFQSMTVMAIVGGQWMFWGYSISFSRTGNRFIGDMSNFLLWNVRASLLLKLPLQSFSDMDKQVMAEPAASSAVLPEVVFCFYEEFFCACATMIVVGGVIERGRVLPSIIFGFCWATIVYCPIAYWTWNPNGWLYNLPGLDFAGGGPVHISSGSAGLAYALVLGKRKHYGEKNIYKPHNVTIVFIGTVSHPLSMILPRRLQADYECQVLIWFGWFGFNGGSALNASMRAMVASFNTHTSACTGVLGWVTVDYLKHGRKFSVIGACEGAIAGLVGITPAAGYVSLWSAAAIGFITAVVISSLQNINEWIHIDDGLEVFKLHGIGGMVGGFLTGCFATVKVSSLDGLTLAPGAIDGNGIQVAKQLAEICAIASYSFTLSCIMLLIMKYIPGMELRVSDEIEMVGIDVDQFFDETVGEWALWEQEGHGTVEGVPQKGSLSRSPSTTEVHESAGEKKA